MSTEIATINIEYPPVEIATVEFIIGGTSGSGGGGGGIEAGDNVTWTGTHTFQGSVDFTGTLSIGGTATLAFTTAEKSKLAAIEAGATADQTGAQIKAAYEAEADTNAFTDADHSKLDGIEAGATADQSDSEIETAYNNQVSQVSSGEKTAGTEVSIRRFSPVDIKDMIDTHASAGGGIGSGDNVTWTGTHAFQGAVSMTAGLAVTGDASIGSVLSVGAITELVADTGVLIDFQTNIKDGVVTTVGVTASGAVAAGSLTIGGVVSLAFTSADHSKLDGIEAGATADQTGAQIKAAYEAEADTNAFTDSDHSKLDGIAAGATANTNQHETVLVACSGETSDLTTGVAVTIPRWPAAMTFASIRADVGTAPSGSGITVLIKTTGGTVTIATITIASGATASSDVVPIPAAISEGEDVQIEISAIGAVTAGAGLKVTFEPTRALP